MAHNSLLESRQSIIYASMPEQLAHSEAYCLHAAQGSHAEALLLLPLSNQVILSLKTLILEASSYIEYSLQDF